MDGPSVDIHGWAGLAWFVLSVLSNARGVVLIVKEFGVLLGHRRARHRKR